MKQLGQPGATGAILLRREDQELQRLPGGRGVKRMLAGPQDGAGFDAHIIELEVGGPDGLYHQHPGSDDMYLVLEGAIRLRLPEGETVVGAGDAVWIPRGVPHRVGLEGDSKARLLEIYSPAPASSEPVDG